MIKFYRHHSSRENGFAPVFILLIVFGVSALILVASGKYERSNQPVTEEVNR